MNVAHTPGPWVVNETGCQLQICHESLTGDLIYDLRIAVICGDLNDGNDDDVLRADAALIAAAPDMLAALQAILPHIDAGEALLARHAIKKALGQ